MLNKFLLFIACSFILPSASIADGLPPLTHQLHKLSTPIKAPQLMLNNLDGEPVVIKKNQVTVVNFWATWCPPCRREMGSLERLYQATKNHDVNVIAIDIGEDEETVFSFLGTVEPSPNFEIVLDLKAETMDVWKVRGLPTTYIINKDGYIVYQAIGGREFDHPNIVNAVLALTK